MKITQEGDYALRAVLYMYKLGIGKRTEAKLIAEHEYIPLRFLLKLLRKLAIAGIVRSYMGYGGGYAVERPPRDISVKDVIEAVEGPISINRCLSDGALCNAGRAGSCEIHKALFGIQGRFAGDLDKITFEKLLEDSPGLPK